MKVLSVINYKGGVGKTTLSANIAAELAYKGKDVLVIDLDPQTNLTLSFIDVNEWTAFDEQSKTIKHWYDNFLDHGRERSLSELIITPIKINNELNQYHAEGKVDLISSHLDLIHVDMELSSLLGGNSERMMRSNFLRVIARLKQSLIELENRYDVVLIDCPPNFNLVTQNAIVASNYYIVPAKPDYLSTLGINTLLRHIEELKEKYNHFVTQSERMESEEIDPIMLGVVFTMVSYYSGQPISTLRDYMSRVEREDIETFTTHMRENKTLFGDAPEHGVPVVLKQRSQVRGELEALVLEITNRANIE